MQINAIYNDVKNYDENTKINFLDLARKYNLKNSKNEMPKNGGQIVKKYLADRGLDFTKFTSIYGSKISNYDRIRRAKIRLESF